MTKNVSHISQRIICPKCGTRNLRKSIPAKPGKEYFCDKDHEYFGITELVNIWNYDGADFYGLDGQTQLETFKEFFTVEFWTVHRNNEAMESREDKLSLPIVEPEGDWSSEIARDEGYGAVNRMLMGVAELEWDFDARDLPYPIGAVGSC